MKRKLLAIVIGLFMLNPGSDFVDRTFEYDDLVMGESKTNSKKRVW